MSEEWRVIPSFSLYEVSSLGGLRRVGSTSTKRPSRAKRGGYLQTNLWQNGVERKAWVHRLVCEAFYGPAPQPRMDVAHHNGVKDDNRPENLRWATRRENEHDKRRHGRDNAGSRNGQAILDEAQVREIRALVPALPRSSGGCRIKKGALGRLAAQYGVTTGAINNILRGTNWRHVG